MASTAEATYSPDGNATPDSNKDAITDNDNIALDGTSQDALSITLTHHGKKHTFAFPLDATITDLSTIVEAELSLPPSHQKYLITPKPGLLRPPFPDPSLPLAPLTSRKIMLMGSTPAEVHKLQQTVSTAASRQALRDKRQYAVKPATPARTVGRGTAGSIKASEEAQYTFHTLRPLAHLPGPERSLAFLERLRDDAGVRAAMRKHGFSVGLLTEMDPAMHTTHESRTLGLNRNRGEVIELRLRTDAYDGYRDYRTIRRTLCHELAHNVWGDHDRNFWNLCRQIEGEVERGDWTRGGRTVGGVGGDEVYEPPVDSDPERRGDVFDHGGWTGGEFVLGSSEQSGPLRGSSGSEVQVGSLSRREILARAADERAKRTKGEGEGKDGDGSGGGGGGGSGNAGGGEGKEL